MCWLSATLGIGFGMAWADGRSTDAPAFTPSRGWMVRSRSKVLRPMTTRLLDPC